MSKAAASNDLKLVKVWLDKGLQSLDEFSDLQGCLSKNGVDYCVERLPVECCIMWSRLKSPSGTRDDADSNTVNFEETQLSYIVVKVQLEHFEKCLEDYERNRRRNELFSFVESIRQKTSTKLVTLILTRKMEEQLQGEDKKRKTKLSKKTLSNAYLDLQLIENVQTKVVETKAEFADYIFMLTKSIADYPNRCDNNDCDFMLTADSNSVKSSLKVDKNGEGVTAIWANMLEKFQLVNKDQAYAIVSKYPSFYSLMTAYKSTSKEDAKMLLADIQVRRGVGVLANVRRIGPELSKKIYQFFTCVDPNQAIVNDEKQ